MARMRTFLPSMAVIVCNLGCGSSPSAADMPESELPLIQTDATAYVFTDETGGTRLPLSYTIRNRSKVTLALPTCTVLPFYDREASHGWVEVKGPECLAGGGMPIVLPPGELYVGTSRPRLVANGVTWVSGTYRLRFEGLMVGDAQGLLPPLTSNAFSVIAP
jgi:hypothetical protein